MRVLEIFNNVTEKEIRDDDNEYRILCTKMTLSDEYNAALLEFKYGRLEMCWKRLWRKKMEIKKCNDEYLVRKIAFLLLEVGLIVLERNRSNFAFRRNVEELIQFYEITVFHDTDQQWRDLFLLYKYKYMVLMGISYAKEDFQFSRPSVNMLLIELNVNPDILIDYVGQKEHYFHHLSRIFIQKYGIAHPIVQFSLAKAIRTYSKTGMVIYTEQIMRLTHLLGQHFLFTNQISAAYNQFLFCTYWMHSKASIWIRLAECCIIHYQQTGQISHSYQKYQSSRMIEGNFSSLITGEPMEEEIEDMSLLAAKLYLQKALHLGDDMERMNANLKLAYVSLMLKEFDHVISYLNQIQEGNISEEFRNVAALYSKIARGFQMESKIDSRH